MGSFPGFLYRQLTFKPKPLPRSVRLDGKTVIVTGSNVGLGLEACKELAEHGAARIILGVRSLGKGENAKQEILAVRPDVDVQVWELDHESFDSVRKFAERAAALDGLDIAILSAGVKNMEYSKSKTGHEAHVQVNHLGTALLSLLLLPSLKATARTKGSLTRMTIVSSENHFWVKFPELASGETLGALDAEQSFGGKGSMNRYNVSKLLNILWMRELSERAGGGAGSVVIINAVNPGFCKSSLHRSHEGGQSFAKMIGWTAAQGGHCLTDAAVRHEDDGKGAYISEQCVKSPSAFVLSKQGRDAQTKIWNETTQLLSAEIPGVDLFAGLEKR